MSVKDQTEARSWMSQAKCQGTGDALFPEPKEQRRMQSFCFDCPIRARCLAEALDHQLEWGIWGGRTERQRRAILRRYPDVESWVEVLCGPGTAQSRRPRERWTDDAIAS